MKLDPIFTDGMVFAAGKPIRIYGTGSGKAVIQFAGYEKTAEFSGESWLLELPPMEYGGPYTLRAELDGTASVLDDIYIGEVFLFAGQSNMQFKLSESTAPPELYRSKDTLRLFATDRLEAKDRFTRDDGWVKADRETVGHWSALAYLAGYDIALKKDVAVGVITCCQGASVIESWVPEGTFESMGINIPAELKHWDHADPRFSIWNGEGTLYGFAFSQVTPFSVNGVVWYQGESNATPAEGAVYLDELIELIRIWRRELGDSALPFVVVQLAECLERAGEGWSLIQMAQADISDKVAKVSTVISADVCENDNIHPPTKEKLAARIAAALCAAI